MENKSKKFRQLLKNPGSVLLSGAHDGISSKLSERAGFHAIWASGFCISASKGIPDVGLVTMTEHLDVTKDINRCTNLPVIADVDNGYGDVINVTRMVAEYESVGIAGICMEDYHHPKRCSLVSGLKRDLVSLEEFASKVKAAKATQQNPDFLVIARTEAFVAGLGLEEALKRANAYADAGADLILIQSKDSTAGEMKAFAAGWGDRIPLVSVPTMYPTTTAAELDGMGYKVIIFANQGLRAAVLSMESVFKQIVDKQTISAVDDQISTLPNIFELVGYDRIKELESRYITS